MLELNDPIKKTSAPTEQEWKGLDKFSDIWNYEIIEKKKKIAENLSHYHWLEMTDSCIFFEAVESVFSVCQAGCCEDIIYSVINQLFGFFDL